MRLRLTALPPMLLALSTLAPAAALATDPDVVVVPSLYRRADPITGAIKIHAGPVGTVPDITDPPVIATLYPNDITSWATMSGPLAAGDFPAIEYQDPLQGLHSIYIYALTVAPGDIEVGMEYAVILWSGPDLHGTIDLVKNLSPRFEGFDFDAQPLP